MAQAPLSRFPIRITAAGDDPDQATIDDFAQTLRRELIDAGAHRIERVPAGPGPEGTRSLELIGLLSFIITATDAGESLAKVIRAIRAVAQRYAKARRPVQVTVGESDVDLATADDQRIASVIAAIEASRPTGVRAALIVANAAYDHAGLTELRAPGADADALAGVLRDPTIGGFDVELITDADERTIRRRLAAFFARRDRDDVLLLHFSCHGVKDFRGRLYFAARDTDLDALGATAVPASFVNDLLDETMAGRVVLILDCCYSGAFARGAATRGDDAVHVNDEFGGGTGRIVLTASSATEYAFEGTAITRADGQPSVFTSALVEGLASGSADLDEDGDISIDELYDYTYRTVRRATPGQAPMKWSYGVEGAVVIARSGRLPALPRTVLDDLDSDRGVLRMEGVKALQRILRDGTPGLRAAAMEALARLKDNDDSLRVRQAADSALSSIIPAQAAGPRAESGPAGGPPTTVTTPRPGAAHVSTAGSASTPAAFGQRPATTPEPATHRGAQAAPSHGPASDVAATPNAAEPEPATHRGAQAAPSQGPASDAATTSGAATYRGAQAAPSQGPAPDAATTPEPATHRAAQAAPSQGPALDAAATPNAAEPEPATHRAAQAEPDPAAHRAPAQAESTAMSPVPAPAAQAEFAAEPAAAKAAPRYETPPTRSVPTDPAPQLTTTAGTPGPQAATGAAATSPAVAKHRVADAPSSGTAGSSTAKATTGAPATGAPTTGGQLPARRLGVAEPRPRTTGPATADEPRPPVTDRLVGARLVAGVLAGLLGIVAALMYVVTFTNHPDTGVEKTGIDIMYVALALSAVVTLVTRRKAWAALMAGLFAWHVAFPVAISAEPLRSSLGTTYPPLATGTFLALAGFVCAIPAALPALDPAAEKSRRVIVALVVAPLAVISGILLFEVVYRLYEGDLSGSAAARMIVAGIAALILPVAGLLAPRDRATHYLLGGWLFGGAIFGFTGIGEQYLSGEWRFATWLPLIAAGIAAAIAFRRPAPEDAAPGS